MNKQRRTEILLDHMKCSLRYFTMDKEEMKFIRKEICKGCSEYFYCINIWKPLLDGMIQGILNAELKQGLIHEKD